MSDDFGRFLADRYDEAEGIAQGLMGATRFMDRNPDFYGTGGPAAEAFWNYFTPIRMLADIKLKRAILAAHPHVGTTGPEEIGCSTCHRDPVFGDVVGEGWCATDRQLSTEFASHPDYRPEWAPEGAPDGT